jgi:hypothetical protein
MSDDSLRAIWRSHPPADQETLMTSIDAVLHEDRAAREKERRSRIASTLVLAVLCPASLWCAAYGKTPLVRGAYALIGVGTAITVFAEWVYLNWARQALPGAADTRSQLQMTAHLLSRQSNLIKAAPLWSAPIFVGVALISLWIYQERSYTAGCVMWAITGAAWLTASVGSLAKSKQINERKSRIERMLSDL